VSRNTTLFAVTLLLSTPLLAQQSADPALQTAQEIVVTASTIQETVEETPASVTIIDREEILDREARDVGDLLREVPGLHLARTGSRGKVTSLFTRGGNSNQTLVLWNGIELNNPYFAGYDFGRFSTAGVDRIEVVRGPYSAIYGSEAVSGVVNILTLPGRDSLEVQLEAGENGWINGSAAGGVVAGNVSLSGAIEHRQDDGWFDNDDFDQNSFHGGARWNDGKLGAALQLRATSYEAGVPFNTSADGTRFVPSLLRRQEGDEVQIAVPLSLAAAGALYELTLSTVERSDDFEDPEDPFANFFSETDSSTRRARFTSRFDAGFAGTIVAGAEYETAEVSDVNAYGPNLNDLERESTSFFAEDRASFSIGTSRLELLAGARYDEFDTFGSELTPSAAAAWLFGKNKLRVSYGEGFRAPSIGELYFPFLGNPSLLPEKSENLEIGFDRFFGSEGSFSVTLFNTDYEELIVYDNATFAFANTGAALARGAELSGVLRILRQGTLSGSYTYLETEQRSTGLPLLRRPEHAGSLSFDWEDSRWGTTFVALFNGERDDIFPVSPYSRTSNGAYTTVDATVRFHLGTLRPYLKMENLLDEEYDEVEGYPSPGRRAIAGLRFSL
jgi:vitamin B12 transporter